MCPTVFSSNSPTRLLPTCEQPEADNPPAFDDHAGGADMNTQTDLQESVRAILKACAELSAAQAAIDRDHELTIVPRDHAVTKVIEAFNRFAAGAQAAKKPLRISITLSPTASSKSGG